MSKYFSFNSHKNLINLVELNIVFDILAIAIWYAFPAVQWSMYRLNFLIVGLEAAIAAGLFALTLFGLRKRQKWAPILIIGITVTQRVFATYVFFPSPAIAITLIWSIIIIYFAIKDIKTTNF